MYPLWIVIVASAVGVTLIALLFTICYKIGWFDRRDFRGNIFDLEIWYGKLCFRIRSTHTGLYRRKNETKRPEPSTINLRPNYEAVKY